MATLHHFDGEQLTVKEIMLRVPALGETAIRTALKAGRNTSYAMLTFDPLAAARAGGARGAKTTSKFIRNSAHGKRRHG
jgi:hypothetical protein